MSLSDKMFILIAQQEYIFLPSELGMGGPFTSCSISVRTFFQIGSVHDEAELRGMSEFCLVGCD